ncbi:carboxylesterase 1-like [Rutidosis leptorrhynchoides]|uniref:carboxylesterase 1-like n=1 Tax=Rutidosis leptorrhynchoides TaxID=125765 RepID=UPI003A98EAFA
MSDNNQSSTGQNPPMLTPNSDGSWTRNVSYPCTLPTPDQDSDTLVLTKDVVINHVNKTSVRIHLPKQTLITTEKLPLIIYYHPGGFVLMSATSTLVHEFCNKLAMQLSAMVVSVDYHLAPEHRLPAAYDDGVEALHWVKSTQDPWLTKFVDFSNCYLMGSSAGASIAYHVGLRVSINDLEPLKVNALILHHLFIGGVDRTESEIRLADAQRVTLSKCDEMWNWSLPVDASLDHEYCNVLVGGGPDDMGRIKDVGWRVMVTGCYGDLLIDRQMEFAKVMEKKGVKIECFYGDGYHIIELNDESKANELINTISRFVSNVSDN